MSKKFRIYEQKQPQLLPPSLDELIGEKELVRVVDRVIGELDTQRLEGIFEGGGSPSYHPEMMLKVIVYAYSSKVYSSRGISRALRRDISFMWLSGGQKPDFNTVNRFRGIYLKDILEEVFAETVGLLLKEGYLSMEDYFVDGTKMEADAGKHSYVWKKNVQRHKERIKERAREIMAEVEKINEKEDQQYEGNDLPELGEGSQIGSKQIEDVVAKINERLARKERKDKKMLDKKVQLLREAGIKMAKYEEQAKILAGRNSYSKTDTEATFMRMKNQELRAAYNVQVGTQKGLIAGFSISQNTNDGTVFKPHMEKQKSLGLPPPKRVMADAAYGNEQNYQYLEKEKIGSYLKYRDWYREHFSKKETPFPRARFEYESEKDSFKCPGNRTLVFKEERIRSGNMVRRYESENCEGCALKKECTKSQGRRSLDVNFRLWNFQKQARENLSSALGIGLRRRRGNEVESVFGDLKRNQDYRRIRLRGLLKAGAEMALIFMSFNLRKLFRLQLTPLPA